VGRLDLAEASVVSPELDPLGPGSIRNDRLGRFALWGFGGVAPAQVGSRPAGGQGAPRDDEGDERGPGQ
jgi:hypothetical protein